MERECVKHCQKLCDVIYGQTLISEENLQVIAQECSASRRDAAQADLTSCTCTQNWNASEIVSICQFLSLFDLDQGFATLFLPCEPQKAN
jgi:hypothetical protein